MTFYRKSLQEKLSTHEGNVAGELGLEPRLTESESVVLPLDDSPEPHLDSRAGLPWQVGHSAQLTDQHDPIIH